MNKKCCITGYAIQTIGGTEDSLDLTRKIGYTQNNQDKWTTCVDQNSLETVYNSIEKTLERAFSKANIDNISRHSMSLVIASNFFENAFWEKNEIQEDERYIAKKLKNKYNINGLIVCDSTACSSGGTAVVTACQVLDDNISDIVIVLGYDIKSIIPKNGMRRLGALAKKKISPFSLDRTGTELADGIGVLIIEPYNIAKDKGSFIYSTIEGYGVNSDAYNPTSPEPSGDALLKSMRDAIKMANISESKIQYINTHGSGTKLNDIIETNVVKNVFGLNACNLFINSSKSIIGHTLGASGIIEIVITIMQMRKKTIHPTANFTESDSLCDLNYCFDEAASCQIEYAISNSIGFGGINVCVILKSGGLNS